MFPLSMETLGWALAAVILFALCLNEHKADTAKTESLLKSLHEKLLQLAGVFGDWAKNVVELISEGAKKPTSRVVGAFVYLLAITGFFWADVAFIVAFLVFIGFPTTGIPSFFMDLAVPLSIGFLGNAFVLGFIIADLIYLDFSRRPKGKLLMLFIWIALLNFVFVLILALLLIVGRLPDYIGADFQPSVAQILRNLGEFALSAIALPTFVTSFFLWPGILALFLLGVGILLAVATIVQGLVEVLRQAALASAKALLFLAAPFIAIARALAYVCKELRDIVKQSAEESSAWASPVQSTTTLPAKATSDTSKDGNETAAAASRAKAPRPTSRKF